MDPQEREVTLCADENCWRRLCATPENSLCFCCRCCEHNTCKGVVVGCPKHGQSCNKKKLIRGNRSKWLRLTDAEISHYIQIGAQAVQSGWEGMDEDVKEDDEELDEGGQSYIDDQAVEEDGGSEECSENDYNRLPGDQHIPAPSSSTPGQFISFFFKHPEDEELKESQKAAVRKMYGNNVRKRNAAMDNIAVDKRSRSGGLQESLRRLRPTPGYPGGPSRAWTITSLGNHGPGPSRSWAIAGLWRPPGTT